MKVKYFPLIAAMIAAIAAAVPAQDSKAAEVIAKHAAAIGPKDKVAGVKNMLVAGTAAFESKLPVINSPGKVIIVSTPENYFYVQSLASKEYPFEKIGYFDSKPSLPFVSPGARSPLGAFITDHERILSDGLLGGTLSARWPFRLGVPKQGRIVYGGTRKINDRKAHVIEYYPSESAGLEFSTRILFDSESYQHLRTEYRRQVNTRQDTFGTLGRQGGAILTLAEDFSDYRITDGMMLPYGYQASYTTESNSGVFQYTWRLKLSQYQFNQNLAADFFTFETK